MSCAGVNKVDSLTEYQRVSPCSAFESQSDTAPTYQIARELLSITGFCLLNCKSWWSLLTFFLLTSQKKWKEIKSDSFSGVGKEEK